MQKHDEHAADTQTASGSHGAITTLDVRPNLERGDDPFVLIMEAAEATGANESLVVVAPFEPVPLYAALAERGFLHETTCLAPDEWHVRFSRQ